MKVKDFSKKVAKYNETIEDIIKQIRTQAPLLLTSFMELKELELLREKQRNQLGLIRVLFLGASSTGKSTIINMLAGKIVVPEVSHTSTMIPTWIGQTDHFGEEGVLVNFFNCDEGSGEIGKELKNKVESFDDFRCFYCFRAEDAADPERRLKPERFKQMELNEAYMRIPSQEGIMNDYSLVLVDTLGNGATLADDQKAQYNMKHADFAFVLLGPYGTIDEGSRSFYATTLFNKDVSNINPDHVVFVINKIDLNPAPSEAMKNCCNSIMSILRLAYGENIPDGLYDKLCSQRVSLSALYNRIVKAGMYPYKEDAMKIYEMNEYDFLHPSNLDMKENVNIVTEKLYAETDIRDNPDEKLLRKGHYSDFETMVGCVVSDLFKDGTIVNNHLSLPESTIKDLLSNIKEKLGSFKATQKDINDKLLQYEIVKDKFKEYFTTFSEECKIIVKSFPSDINTYLGNNRLAILAAYGAKSESILQSVDIKLETKAKYNTGKMLRNMSTTQMANVIIPEYNDYKNQLVHVLCDTISNHIFRPTVKSQTTLTPFETVDKKLMQSINHYLTQVLSAYKKLNNDGTVLFAVPEKETFENFINEKMHFLTLQLIKTVKGDVDHVLEGNMASDLVKSLHGWGDGWKSFWGKDVSYFYNKLNEAARRSFTKAVDEHFKKMENQVFINEKMSETIFHTLYDIVIYVHELMNDYQNSVEVEIRSLKKEKTTFEAQSSYYYNFADQQIIKPLQEMATSIKNDRIAIMTNGVER